MQKASQYGNSKSIGLYNAQYQHNSQNILWFQLGVLIKFVCSLDKRYHDISRLADRALL